MTRPDYNRLVSNVNFNSHAHVGRDVAANQIDLETYNFNSHAHVGRDMLALLSILPRLISTHTPTWGVTVQE